MPIVPSTQRLAPGARDALNDLLDRDDPAIVGVVLTGSAARGLSTEHSDVDVIVIRDEDPSSRIVTRSQAVDEIPMTLAELETFLPVGSPGAGFRWQFAWANVLSDHTGGRVTAAVHRQASLDDAEQWHVLLGLSRLDEFVNFAYRALKSHRDGRALEARLDSAESVGSLLDIVFALNGRVRPYNKYLAWELREHPLAQGVGQVEPFVRRVIGLLDGSEAAMREAFGAVERACRQYDESAGTTALTEMIDHWGPDLVLLRGHSQGGPG